ncbi:MAG: ABC transporter substrate-binding protein, partial [Planctomycetota bacterium]
GIDGPSTHLAEQVVAKARLTLLSPASSDKTVNLANVPWMFSCLPGDHLQVGVLAAQLEARVGRRPLAIVSTDDHDSRLFTRELRKSLTELRMAPRYHFECRRATREIAELAEHVVQLEVDAVVLVAGAGDSARLLRALRGRGFAGSVFGGPAMGRRRFLEQAAGTAPQEWSAAEGVLFPLLYQPNEKSGGFASIFKSRFGKSPDYAAAHTYDAVRLLVAAIRKAGLNRARIRDAVEELSPWAGTTGTVKWDPLGANTRAAGLGTIRDGHLVPADKCDKTLAASNSR